MPAINIVSSVFSLTKLYLGKATLDSGKLDLDLGQRALMALHDRPVFALRITDLWITSSLFD